MNLNTQKEDKDKDKENPILIEFDCDVTSPSLLKLKSLLQGYVLPVREKDLGNPNQINIHGNIEVETLPLFDQLFNKYCSQQPQEIASNLICSIIYQQEESELSEIPTHRTIVIRENLPQLINFHYEIEATFNEMESFKVIGDLILSLVNLSEDKEISYFDQKSSSFEFKKGEKSAMDIWKNMLYQIHGMECDKVEVIASIFPTMESLMQDLGGARRIEEICTMNHLEKPKKIKKNTIRKIEQVFLSLEAEEIMD